MCDEWTNIRRHLIFIHHRFASICVFVPLWPPDLPICKWSRGQRSPVDGGSIQKKVISRTGKERRSGTGLGRCQSAHRVALELGARSPSPFDPVRVREAEWDGVWPVTWLLGWRERREKEESRRGMGEEKKRKQDFQKRASLLLGDFLMLCSLKQMGKKEKVYKFSLLTFFF